MRTCKNKIIRKKIIALLLAGSMAFTYAARTPVFATETKNDAGSTEAGSTEAGSGSTEDTENKDSKPKTEELKDDHGRITIWEWEHVTKKNFTDFMDDNKFHASMFFYIDSDTERKKNNWKTTEPKGFISTYDDKTHIKRSYGDEEWIQYWDKVTNDQATWNTFTNANFNWNCSHSNFLQAFAEQNSKMIQMDEQSTSLNGTGVYFKEKFVTLKGGSLGVPYVKCVKSGTDIIANLKSGGKFSQWCAQIKMYIQPISSKNASKDNNLDLGTRSTDTYVEINRGRAGNEPGISVWKGTVGDNNKAITLHPATGDDNSDFWVMKNLIGLNHEELDYCKVCDNDEEKASETGPTVGVTKSGYLVGYEAKRLNGYGGGEYSVDHFTTRGSHHNYARNIFWPEAPGVYALFKWYVGTPHVFATIKGQAGADGKENGGDEVTGEGRVTKIGKGQVYCVKDTTYKDDSGALQRSEGVILPETSTMIIQKGGILSVESNMINNGKIICDGGTIIIKPSEKEGEPDGCISPFMDTKEGTIEVKNGGTIIVMPGCKLFTLSDKCMNDRNSKLYGYGAGGDPALLLTSGATIINYGLMVNSYAKMDSSSVIENRKDGVILAAHVRTLKEALLYKSKVTGKGADTKVEYIEPMAYSTYKTKSTIYPPKTYFEYYGGIRGVVVGVDDSSGGGGGDIVALPDFMKKNEIVIPAVASAAASSEEKDDGQTKTTARNAGTIRCDKTATVVHQWKAKVCLDDKDYDFTKQITYFTPEY